MPTGYMANNRKIKARATVHWGGSYLDNIEISTALNTQENHIHSVSPTIKNQVANEKTTVPSLWAVPDGTTSISDYYFAPSTQAEQASYEFGWWGGDVSDGSGDFAFPVVLRVKVATRPVAGLVVVGDSVRGEYPVDFSVRVYTGMGSTLLSHVQSVTGNSSVSWSISGLDIANATLLELRVTKWSKANDVVKICEFFPTSATAVYDGDDIESFTLLQESDVKGATIPIGNISCNELDLALINIEDDFFPKNTAAIYREAIKKNRKIELEIGYENSIGIIEYTPMGTYWSGDWQMEETGTTASTTAQDRMSLLKKTTYKSGDITSNQTLGQLAEAVLTDAALSLPDLTYNIDSSLYDTDYTVPLGWFPRASHFDALKAISEAALGRVYVDNNDVIQVSGPNMPPEYSLEITSDEYFKRTQPARSEDVANYVEVKTSPLQQIVEESSTIIDIYESKNPITMAKDEVQTFVVEFGDKKPATNLTLELIAEAGSSFAGSEDKTLYSWGAEITITCTTAGSFKIKITGEQYEIENVEIAIAQDANSIFEYHEQRYELKSKHLIQALTAAKKAADRLLDVYKYPAKDIELEWIGNPELSLGDVFRAPEYVKGAIEEKGDFELFKRKLSYDGGLRSTISGRRINAISTLVLQDTDGTSIVYQDSDIDTVFTLQD